MSADRDLGLPIGEHDRLASGATVRGVALVSVDSSNIAKVGWSAMGRGTVFVVFHGGASWAYAPVPRQVYEDMLIAESPGRYFAANVKAAPWSARVVIEPAAPREQEAAAAAGEPESFAELGAE